MAVELLTFPAALALIMSQGACGGVLELFNSIIHDYAKGIDQCPIDRDVQSEVDLILKHLLMQLKSHTQIKDAMVRPANTQLDGVDMESSRSNDDSERDDHLVPIRVCGEGDGGHRCPYFPCPDCHRSRSIFIHESNLDARSQSYHSNSDRRTLMTDEELDEVSDQEASFIIGSNADDREVVCTDKSVPVVACGEGDGGHRCPYFPCPDCHRTRRIFVSEPDCKLGCVTSTNFEKDMIPHADVGYHFVSGIDVQSGLTCPNEGHTCPNEGHTCPSFPCSICHRQGEFQSHVYP